MTAAIPVMIGLMIAFGASQPANQAALTAAGVKTVPYVSAVDVEYNR